ncbi:hypothetical protein D3C72_1339850 [compost metagenome]
MRIVLQPLREIRTHETRRKRVAGHAVGAVLHGQCAGERRDGALGGRVGGDVRHGRLPRHGRHQDDAAETPLAHAGQDGAGAMERAVDVHVLQRLPLGGGHLHHRFAVLVAGIADEHVDGQASGIQLRHGVRHRGIVGHIEGRGMRPDALFGQTRAGGLAGLPRQVIDHHLRAGLSQRPRNGVAQPPRRPRHQRDATRQSERLVQIIVFQRCLLVLYAPDLWVRPVSSSAFGMQNKVDINLNIRDYF